MAGKAIGISFTIGASVGASVASAFASVNEKLRATQTSFRNASRQSRQLSEAAALREKRYALATRASAQMRETGRVDTALRNELRKLSLAYAEAAKRAGVYGQSLEEIRRRQQAMAQSVEAAQRRMQRLGQIQGARNVMQTESGNRRQAVQSAFSGVAAAMAMAAPLKIGMEFDEAMSRVRAISGATGEDFAKLRAQARELGASTVWSAKEAAEGMTFLSMAGFKTNQTLAAMPGMLSLASAGAMDLASTADIASNVLSGFGMDASKMTYVADVMAKTFTNSNTSIRSIGESMKYCAPAAKAANQSFQDVAAMIGKLGDAGIQGSMAGTGLNAIMMRMASPPKMASDAMAMLNLSIADANGNIRAMPDILRELGAKLSQMKGVDRVDFARKIFGMENAKAGLILMQQALSGELQKMSANLYEKGYADNVANEQTNNLAGDLKGLNSAMQEVAICITDIVTPPLRQLVGTITPIVRSTGQWIQENPRLAQGLLLLGGAFVALKAGALAFTLINSYRKSFGAGLTVMRGQAREAIGGVTGAFGRMRAALNQPVSVAFGQAQANINSFRGRLASLRSTAAQTVSRLRQIGPASIMAGAQAAASGAMAATGRAGFNMLRLGVRGVGMAFKTAFGPMSLMMMGLSLGVDYIMEHWDQIRPYFQALWDGVKAVFNSVMAWLQPIIDKIMGFISPVIDKIGGLLSSMGKAWDWITGNDKEIERKTREQEEAKKRKADPANSLSAEDEAALAAAEKRDQGIGVNPPVEAALKTPAQMQEEERWASEFANAKEDHAKAQAAEKARQKAEKASKKKGKKKNPIAETQAMMDELGDDYGDNLEDADPGDYLSGAPKRKPRAAAKSAPVPAPAQGQPETQIVQPQVQVQLSITQNGIPDAEFATGVMNAIKSRQSELEAMISAIVNEQARLAYG